MPPRAAVSADTTQGRHDHAERRRMIRKGRESGGSLYITGAQLALAGYGPDEPPPFYRTWAGPRGRVVVQLYREK